MYDLGMCGFSFACYSEKCSTQIISSFVWSRHVSVCPLEGHIHGDREVKETSVIVVYSRASKH